MIEFTKMHGAGNDFVVIDCVRQTVDMTPRLARALADRHRGVGCDQILLVERSDHPQAAFRYRIFNGDGGEVEQCGNGARCFVRFVHDKGLLEHRTVKVSTRAGLIELTLEPGGDVTVDMGAPRFAPAEVPFDAAGLLPSRQGLLDWWPIELEGALHRVGVVSMGNPHAVQLVDALEAYPVRAVGQLLECHPRFPSRVNAGFMQVISREEIRIRVFERGAGETLACGTGACAAVVAGIRAGLLAPRVRVLAHGGVLTIAWAGGENPVMMSGPAVAVFDGRIDEQALVAVCGARQQVNQ